MAKARKNVDGPRAVLVLAEFPEYLSKSPWKGGNVAKVDPSDYGFTGERKPALLPDMIGKAHAVVLTVVEARTGIRTANGPRAVLEFAEFPDNVFWLGTFDVMALVQKLGDDDETWPGHKVPLVRKRVFSNRAKKQIDVFNVAADDEWDDIIAESEGEGGSDEKPPARKAPARGRAR